MEVITLESKAFKELMQKVEKIAEFVFKQENDNSQNTDESVWLDNDQLSDMLGISTRTLQRLRTDNDQLSDMLGISTRTLQRLRTDNQISYTKLGRKCIYRLSDVQHAINSRIIECNPKTLDGYRTN